jgi:hypothetical protein
MHNVYLYHEVNSTNMSQNRELERSKTKIARWLTEDGYKIQDIPDPNSQFHIVAEHASGIKFDIVHPSNTTDKLLMLAGVLLAPDRKQKLDAMDHEKRLDLFWDLRFTLLRTGGIGFQNLDYTSDRYQLQSVAYYDGLNKNVFMDKLHHLQDMMLYLLMTFDKQFGQPAPSPDLGYIG